MARLEENGFEEAGWSRSSSRRTQAWEPPPLVAIDNPSWTPDGDAQQATALRGVLEKLVFPALAFSPRAAESACALSSGVLARWQEDIATLCKSASRGALAEIASTIERARERGFDIDSILLDLLGGAAEQLGVQWDRDESAFSEVTIGISRLQETLRQLALTQPAEVVAHPPPGRVLLAPSPGEQHNFGVMILDQFLYRAGWDVRTLPSGTIKGLVEASARTHFDVVGLSVSCDEFLPGAAEAIDRIRKVSRNRKVAILAGGRAFLERPELARKIGADALAADGRAAVNVAARLVERDQPDFLHMRKL